MSSPRSTPFSMDTFESSITSFYRPTVMISNSSDVNRLLSKNLLTITNLLLPFCNDIKKCNINSNNLVMKPAINDTSFDYKLKNFGIKLVHCDTIKEYNMNLLSNSIENKLENALIQTDSKYNALEIREKEDVKYVLNNNNPTPWFTRYKNLFMEYLRFADDDYLDQPIGYIIAVSSSENDPLGQLERLSRAKSLPSMFQNGSYDPNLYRLHVLIHENTENEEAKARTNKLMQDMKKIYAQGSCRLLIVNSLASPNFNQPDIWEHTATSTFGVKTPATSPETNNSYQAAISRKMTLGDGPPLIDDTSLNISRKNSIDLSNSNLDPLINSNNPNSSEHPLSVNVPNNLFSFSNDILPEVSNRGAYLSPSDLEGVSTLVSDLIKGVINHIQKRLMFLHEQVTTNRKGFGNRLKAMFGRKIKEGGKYDILSIESQTRQLADLSFLMQDYDSAIEHYQFCLTDYKQDKNWKPLASCSEFLALSMILNAINIFSENSQNKSATSATSLLNYVSKRDLETSIDNAFHTYKLVGDIKRATRTVIWASDAYINLIPGKLRDASQLLLRASESESNVRSALLLEQTAFSFLKEDSISPIQVRKYAFHLIMAGHLFNKCPGQRLHAVRCYSSALNLYKERSWDHIEDHINFILGRQLFALNDIDGAVQHFLSLIATGRQPLDRQNTFLKEFVFKYYSSIEESLKSPKSIVNPKEEFLIKNLFLPTFNDNSVAINPNSSRIISSLGNNIWSKSVHMPMCLPLNGKIFESPDLLHQTEFPMRGIQTGYVGESITVRFSMSNPLLIKFEVQNLHLRCSFENSKGFQDSNSFEINKINVVVNPTSDVVVDLLVTPKVGNGSLTILGVEWELFGLIYGYHQFSIPMKRLNASSEQKKSKHYAPDGVLTIDIKDISPLLNIDINWSDCNSLMHGELVLFDLEIVNNGKLATDQISIKCNLPSFAIFGLPVDENLSYEEKLVHVLNTECMPWNHHSIINFPTNTMAESQFTKMFGTFLLESGGKLKFPLLIRASSIGKFSLEFLIKYSNNSYSSIPPRFVHLSKKLEVFSSIVANSFSRPAFERLYDHFLGIEIENSLKKSPIDELKSSSIQILNAISFSPSWKILPFSSNYQSCTIKPFETNTLFFNLTNSTSEATAPTSISIDIASVVGSPLASPPLSPSNSPRQESKGLKSMENLAKYIKSAVKVNNDILSNLDLELVYVNFNPLFQFLHYERNDLESAVINDAIDLIMLYVINNSKSSRYCVHHMLRIPFRPGSAPGACPLRMTVDCINSISYDFSKPLNINVKISVRNSSDMPVTFLFETLPVEEEFDPSTRSFRVRTSSIVGGRYLWQGETRRRIIGLDSNSTEVFNLSACIADSGVYNMNRFRFQLESDNGAAPRVFFFPLQHLLFVNCNNLPDLISSSADAVEIL